MEIVKNMDGTTLKVQLIGRLDTNTSPALDESLGQESGFTDVDFDFEKLDYLSSAGIRLLFSCRKKLGGAEHVVIRNANEVIREIFRVTGFERQITLK